MIRAALLLSVALLLFPACTKKSELDEKSELLMKETGAQLRDCLNDAIQFCPNTVLAELKPCLAKHTAKLSSVCKQALLK